MFRLLVSTLLIGAANGLFFHIKQGEVKCFVEEVPDETMVSGMDSHIPFFSPLSNFSFSLFCHVLHHQCTISACGAAFKNVCCLAVSNERRLGVFRNIATLLKAFKPEYWSEAAVVFSRARVDWWEGEGVAEYSWVLARLSFLLHLYTVTMGFGSGHCEFFRLTHTKLLLIIEY